jgi:hypothetical protein
MECNRAKRRLGTYPRNEGYERGKARNDALTKL